MEEQVDEVTGLSRKVIIESKDPDLRPRISIKDRRAADDASRRYMMPVGVEHRR